MKIEKFKVLLYLKKSGTDKSGKAPIMGRITVNRTREILRNEARHHGVDMDRLIMPGDGESITL